MLGMGIHMWSDGYRDACTPYLNGVPHSPATEWVESGTRLIDVPCDDWFMRMPMRIQILCLVELLLAILFVLNALGDTRKWLQQRRGPG